MTDLSAIGADLDGIRSSKDDFNKWVTDTQKLLKDIQNRPTKLRSEAAQQEINQLQEILKV